MSKITEDDVLRVLQASPKPLSPGQIKRGCKVRKKLDWDQFTGLLQKMEKKGLIVRNDKDTFTVPGGPVKALVERQPRGEKIGKTGAKEQKNIVGLVVREGSRFQLKSCDKKDSTRYTLAEEDMGDAVEGDIAVVRPVSGGSKRKTDRAVRVGTVIGRKDTPGIQTLISIHEQGLHTKFNDAALGETHLMTVPALGNREDLRNIPLVTVDGADARDFDDAIFAEPDGQGGFHLIVAIADVSWYVRPGSELDKEAYDRGNSTYFPDRVLPMLPEKLSNGLCSLKPHEDRAVMAAHLWLDKDGNLTAYKFNRGLMNSAARLTYEQLQAAKDGQPDTVTAPLMNNVVKPLYAAYDILKAAREKRGVMDLDGNERKIAVGDDGTVGSVGKYARVDSHKVIEEFMILANVAAASALEDENEPCVYRTHDSPPDTKKLEQLRELAQSFGLTMPKAIESPADFRDILRQSADKPFAAVISNAILRLQAKAVYSTQNKGHFGLVLDRYAHFTSPIRRYADLLVHRSLTDAFNMGAGGLNAGQRKNLPEMADHISKTERHSDEGERSSRDRLTASFLSAHIGKDYTGRIQSVARGGFFVRLNGTGADGFVPLNLLPNDDQYACDIQARTVTGSKTGRIYRAGADIELQLVRADGLSGAIILKPANDNSADLPQVLPRKPPQSETKRIVGGRAHAETARFHHFLDIFLKNLILAA